MRHPMILALCALLPLFAARTAAQETHDDSPASGASTQTDPSPTSSAVPPAGAPDAAQTATTAEQTSASDNTQDKPAEEVIVLEPFSVTDSTQLSFHFSMRITRSKPGNRILAIEVSRVLQSSDADQAGLCPGMRIIAIDGKRVEEYDGTFLNGSELNKIFIGRPEGAQVTLLVTDADGTNRKKIELTRHRHPWLRTW